MDYGDFFKHPWLVRVRTWGRLPATVKLAWMEIWQRVPREGRAVVCTDVELGESQGKDALRGRRCIRSMQLRGLAFVIEQRPGEYTVALVNPRPVFKRAPRRADLPFLCGACGVFTVADFEADQPIWRCPRCFEVVGGRQLQMTAEG